jgi:hypothetical protein
VEYIPGSLVPVSGRGVAAGQYLRLGSDWSEIQATVDGGLAFALPSTVGAGPQLAVLLGTQSAKAWTPIPGTAAQILRVRPRVKSISACRNAREELVVKLVVAPPLDHDFSLSLTAMPPAPGSPSISVPVASPWVPTAEFALKPPPLGPGRYLATVDVGGVSSLLVYRNGRYVGPRVEVA